MKRSLWVEKFIFVRGYFQYFCKICNKSQGYTGTFVENVRKKKINPPYNALFCHVQLYCTVVRCLFRDN
jgi:hypothetical protein